KVVFAESRAERLEAGVLHARGRIQLQERLADQWAVPIAVVPLRIERPGERVDDYDHHL
ncbi:hypothetical protein KI387_028127, partial [Taxus chinensis]